MSDTTKNQENKIKEQTPEPSQVGTIMEFTKELYETGRIEKEQVDVMQKFVNGEVDYATMRSMCG